MNPFKLKDTDNEGEMIGKAIMMIGIILLGLLFILEVSYTIYTIIVH